MTQYPYTLWHSKGAYRVSQVLFEANVFARKNICLEYISLPTYHALRWTPADPPQSYQNDWIVLASAFCTASPSACSVLRCCIKLTRSAIRPCGLLVSLCTLHVIRYLQTCNTRYGWMVNPYPAGTCTPQEMPSFAWRTHPTLAAEHFSLNRFSCVSEIRNFSDSRV